MRPVEEVAPWGVAVGGVAGLALRTPRCLPRCRALLACTAQEPQSEGKKAWGGVPGHQAEVSAPASTAQPTLYMAEVCRGAVHHRL